MNGVSPNVGGDFNSAYLSDGFYISAFPVKQQRNNQTFFSFPGPSTKTLAGLGRNNTLIMDGASDPQ